MWTKSGASPATLWKTLPDGRVACALCAHRCEIAPGHEGVCKVRSNEGGALVTRATRIVAQAVDPIEKKPFYHFLPGSMSFSLAAAGCNFRCDFCQNWSMSQAPRRPYPASPGHEVEPEAVVRLAKEAGCATLAFTYTEPTIFFELAKAVGTLGRAAGLKNLFVTNGFLTPEAVEAAKEFLDAANVDLKCFREDTYRRVCGGTLKGVQAGLEALLEAGMWVEVTTLVVPGVNDGEAELRGIAQYLVGLSQDLPWHLSRFHPDYRRTEGVPTPVATLERAWELGREAGLRYVYLGNCQGHPSESTRCPTCDTIVAQRAGFRLPEVRLVQGACPSCSGRIAGRWR